MASIGREHGGLRILFVSPDGKRKTLRLGKVSRRQVEAVKVKVEALLAAAITATPRMKRFPDGWPVWATTWPTGWRPWG